eukprot:8865004-Pyramimonas_sp.AAC.1
MLTIERFITTLAGMVEDWCPVSWCDNNLTLPVCYLLFDFQYEIYQYETGSGRWGVDQCRNRHMWVLGCYGQLEVYDPMYR